MFTIETTIDIAAPLPLALAAVTTFLRSLTSYLTTGAAHPYPKAARGARHDPRR
jgi:hypothetical protein